MGVTLLLLVCSTWRPEALDAWAEREAWVMGTRLTVRLADVDDDRASASAEAVIRSVEGSDALFSTWRDETPLSRLNRAPVGETTELPQRLLTTLAEAFAWSGETEGAFDPAVGPLIDAWGVRSGGRIPKAEEVERALERSGSSAFHLDARAGRATRTSDGAWIDAGAFGKGAALRDVEALLIARGVDRAIVDLGGQVLVLAPEDEPVSFDVAHPADRRRPEVGLRLTGSLSAATSGASERPGHLLDPRTGRPVDAWGSVTVVADDPLIADVLSTALHVMGPEDGFAWASARPDIAALFLTVDGGAVSRHWTPSMERWIATPATPSSPTRF